MKINFIGDSITAGAGASTIENGYVNLVGSLSGNVVKNFGVSGTRLARQKSLSNEAMYDYDFQMRMKLMAEMEGDADFVFVFGGTNDFGHGDAIIGNDQDSSPYTFYGAINNIITYLIQKFSKEKVCFILPMPRYNQECRYGEGNKKQESLTLKEYVEIIKERLEFYNVDYIDLFHDFLPVPQTNGVSEYFFDGLHPNDKGHLLIAKKVVEYLKNKEF